MRKIVAVLLLTALAMPMARLASETLVLSTRIGAIFLDPAPSLETPPLMYAGIRG